MMICFVFGLIVGQRLDYAVANSAVINQRWADGLRQISWKTQSKNEVSDLSKTDRM